MSILWSNNTSKTWTQQSFWWARKIHNQRTFIQKTWSALNWCRTLIATYRMGKVALGSPVIVHSKIPRIQEDIKVYHKWNSIRILSTLIKGQRYLDLRTKVLTRVKDQRLASFLIDKLRSHKIFLQFWTKINKIWGLKAHNPKKTIILPSWPLKTKFKPSHIP